MTATGVPAARWGEVGPSRQQTATVPAALVGAVQRLSSATSVVDVAQAAVAGALTLADARAVALTLLADRGRSVEIVASAGYDCDSMAAGARLPIDAGLPVTECVRTGRSRITSAAGGPRWVVAPLTPGLRAPRGALLISLSDGADAPDLAVVESFALGVGTALQRARRHDAVAQRAAAATNALRTTVDLSVLPLDVAVHLVAASDDVSGDLVDAWAADRDSWWVFVADVCGAGYDVAPVAASLRLAARAAGRHAGSPAALLSDLDQVLEDDPAVDRFVTAVATRLTRRGRGFRAEVALAGHPSPLLWRDGRVERLGESGPALNLGLGLTVGAAQETLDLRPGDTLLLHTDGLPDRLGHRDGEDRLVELFARAAAAGSAAAALEEMAVALHADPGGAASAGSVHDDDATVAVLRVP